MLTITPPDPLKKQSIIENASVPILIKSTKIIKMRPFDFERSSASSALNYFSIVILTQIVTPSIFEQIILESFDSISP